MIVTLVPVNVGPEAFGPYDVVKFHFTQATGLTALLADNSTIWVSLPPGEPYCLAAEDNPR